MHIRCWIQGRGSLGAQASPLSFNDIHKCIVCGIATFLHRHFLVAVKIIKDTQKIFSFVDIISFKMMHSDEALFPFLGCGLSRANRTRLQSHSMN